MCAIESSNYDDGTLMNRWLQPYLDAVSNVTSSNDATTMVRAVIHKLLQDSSIFIGYNIMKQHLIMTTTKTGSSIDPKLLNTLDLYSYGTISDYMGDPRHDIYMTLTDAQVTKLRQLTALSVIIDHHQQGTISYHNIHTAAFMNDNMNSLTVSMQDPEQTTSIAAASATTAIIRETESLLSPLIASKMIVGKLSQKKMSFILGLSHGKNNKSTTTTNNSSSETQYIDAGATITTDSSFSKSSLVIQSRDINVSEGEPTNAVPKLISHVQRIRTQINDAHQRLIKNSQPDQEHLASSSSQTASTMMTTTMPMEVERIHLSTTTTSAKRSRSSDGSTQTN